MAGWNNHMDKTFQPHGRIPLSENRLSSSSTVDQLCLDPQSTCCQELGGVAQVFRSSTQLVGD